MTNTNPSVKQMVSELEDIISLGENARSEELRLELVKDVYTRTEKIVYILIGKLYSDFLLSTVLYTWEQVKLNESEIWSFWTTSRMRETVGEIASNDLHPKKVLFLDLLRTIDECSENLQETKTPFPQIYSMIEKAEEMASSITLEEKDFVLKFSYLTTSILTCTVNFLGDDVAKNTYGQLWAFSRLLSSQDATSLSRELLTTIWQSMEYYKEGHHQADLGGLAIHVLGDAQDLLASGGSIEDIVSGLLAIKLRLKELQVAPETTIKEQLVPIRYPAGTTLTHRSFG